MKKIFAVSFWAIAAVSAAHATIMSQENIVAGTNVQITKPTEGDNAGKVVISSTNTTYSGMTTSEINAGSGTTHRLVSPANLKTAIQKWAPDSALTGYSAADSISAIAATDTIIQALGKLEKKADDATPKSDIIGTNGISVSVPASGQTDAGKVVVKTASIYGIGGGGAATAAKTVSIPSITSLEVGQIIVVKPSETSTVANSTLKLNSFDAYPMRYGNAAITTSTDSIVWYANYPSIFIFDGSYWVFAGHGLDNNTTYSTMSVAEGLAGTADSNRSLQAVNLKQIIQGLAPGSALTGYEKAETVAAVAATDTISDAIGKLEKAIDGKLDSGSYVPTSRKVNNKALSSDITLTASDVSAVAATQSTKGGILTTNTSSGAVEVSSTIAPSKIATDASNRFVTDSEKSTWSGKQNALGYTAENVANKETRTTGYDTTSDTKYPTTKVVNQMIIDGKADINGTLTDLGNNKQNKIAAGTAGNVVTYSGTQGTFGTPLGFDNAPTANSTNLVKSGAIKTALDAKQDKLTSSNVTTSGTGAVVVGVSASNGAVTVSKGNVQIPSGSETATTYASIWVE